MKTPNVLPYVLLVLTAVLIGVPAWGQPIQAVLTRVGGYDTSGTAEGLQVVGNYAFVADGSAGLQVVDVSDPASPVRVGGYDTSGTAIDVQVVENYAFVADGSAGLQVIDVSNPANPVWLGGYDTSGTARDVQVVGNYAYVADGSAGLQVIVVSNPANPVPVGSLVGFETISSASSVEVVGHYAYVADAGFYDGFSFHNNGLRVVDVSNPASPVQVGRYSDSDTPRISATSLQVVGNYAYLTDATHSGSERDPGFRGGGLQVIDVSNPAAPVRVGNWVGSHGAAHGVQVVGSYAYVTDEGYRDSLPPKTVDGGVQVIDVGNPSAPVGVGRYDIGGGARGVQVKGNYAFVTAGTGLQIVGIRLETDHLSQEILWHETTDATLILNVEYPLSATASSGLPVTLQVVSGPAVLANGTITVTGPGTVVVSAEQVGNLTYLPTRAARSFNGPQPQTISWQGTTDFILALNIDYPLGATASSGLPVTLRVEGGPAVIANGTITVTGMGAVVVSVEQAGDAANLPTQAIRSFNGDKQVQLSLVGSFNTYGLANGVQVVGRYAYVADGGGGPPLSGPVQGGGLKVFDVGNPARPGRVSGIGDFEYGIGATDVQVVGNYAYVADGAGLQVMNLGNPANPAPLGRVNTSGSAVGVQVVGNYAYVADGAAGLQVIDVSRPSAPVRVGGYNTSGSAVGVQVIGKYAYLADGEAGLQVIDVSNPASPVWVGGYDTSGSAQRVQVVGNFAYVADRDAGLQVIDVSDLAKPVRVGGYYAAAELGAALGLHLVGNYAYVANWLGGSQVIDVSDPANPTQVGGFGIGAGYVQNVWVIGNYAYVAGLYITDGFIGNPGVQILEIRSGFPQEVTWQGTSEEFLTPNVAYPLGATVNSGLPVTLRVDSGPAVLVNGTIMATGLGTVVVSAEQAGNQFYLPASVERTVSVIPRVLDVRRAGGQVELFWATGFGGLQLQGRDTLSPENPWQNVTTPPVELDGEVRVPLDPATSHHYFRLLNP